MEGGETSGEWETEGGEGGERERRLREGERRGGA